MISDLNQLAREIIESNQYLALATADKERRKVYGFYRITPVRVWMNNPNANVDERVTINL